MQNKLEIVYIPTKDIHPYGNNNKTHADNVDSIANSIECFGFQIPIVVNKDHVVITGHGRLMAAQKLGIEEIPCIVSDLDKAAEDEFRIIDNVTQSLGKLDFASVAKEIMGGRVHSKYLQEMKNIITDIKNIKPLDPKILKKRNMMPAAVGLAAEIVGAVEDTPDAAEQPNTDEYAIVGWDKV